MFSKMITRAALALGVGLGLATAPVMAQELNFGIISTESSQSLKEHWQPLLDDMQKQTGLKVNAFFASDYAGVIEAMRFNKVQIASFGNKSAMEAVDRANAEIFAKIVQADGSEGYYSHLIVNRDSKLNSVDDVLKHGKELSFGNGDPNSTSGYLVPGYYVFAKNHIDPKTFFKITRGANHEANALAVANKQVDVATNNSENLELLQRTQPAKFAQIKVIWTSPLIPSDPFAWRSDLDPAVKAKIQAFFVNYGKTDAHEKMVLKNLYGWGGFRASNNDQLKPTRQIDLFTRRVKTEADTTLSDADKAARLAEIDKKLAELN